MLPAARVNRRAFSRATSLIVSLSLVGVAAIAPPIVSADGETIEVATAFTDETFTTIEYVGTGTPDTTYPVRIRVADSCAAAVEPEAELPFAPLLEIDSGGSGFGSIVPDDPIQPGWFVVAVMLSTDETTTLATSACFEVTGTLVPPVPGLYPPVLQRVTIVEPARTTIVLDYSRSEEDATCDSALDPASTPDVTDFVVESSGFVATVDLVDLSSGDGCPATARLQLADPLPSGETFVSYTPGTTPLQNQGDQPADAFEIGQGEVLETASAVVAPGTFLSTDGEDDGAQPWDPIETIVNVHNSGLAGNVSIGESHTGGLAGSIPGLHMLSLQSSISADTGTVTHPLEIEFIVDPGQLIDQFNGQPFPASELEVLAHGVPIEPCTSPANADPEPCEVLRTEQPDGIHINVRATASERIWTFGYDLAPTMFALESQYLASYDHAILTFLEELDVASLPSEDDFTVLVDGVPHDTTHVTLLATGLNAFASGLGVVDGLTFLELGWDGAVSGFGEVTITYTPGADPLRDLRGNQVPATTTSLGLLGEDFVAGLMEDATGPEHLLLFLPGPLGSLPGASDFEVNVDGDIQTPTNLVRRFPHLGVTLLDLTLPTPVQAYAGVSVTYIGAAPLTFTDGTASPQVFDLFVDTSGLGMVSGSTEPGEVGEPVVVTPRDASTLAATTTITFPEVLSGGVTTVASDIETSAPEPIPSNFSLGDPPTYYEISTTATFVAPAEVCIAYNAGSFTDESQVRLLHFTDDDWIDVTSSLDQPGNIVCGLVDAFSPFAIVETATGVTYDFTGFFSPVDNLPTVNTVSSGRAIPVKFSLGGDRGLDILEAGSPASVRVACPSNPPLDGIEMTVPTDSNSLSYHAGSDQYTYVWKTSKAWAGTCRMLTVTFNDGTVAEALFKFAK